MGEREGERERESVCVCVCLEWTSEYLREARARMAPVGNPITARSYIWSIQYPTQSEQLLVNATPLSMPPSNGNKQREREREREIKGSKKRGEIGERREHRDTRWNAEHTRKKRGREERKRREEGDWVLLAASLGQHLYRFIWIHVIHRLYTFSAHVI